MVQTAQYSADCEIECEVADRELQLGIVSPANLMDTGREDAAFQEGEEQGVPSATLEGLRLSPHHVVVFSDSMCTSNILRSRNCSTVFTAGAKPEHIRLTMLQPNVFSGHYTRSNQCKRCVNTESKKCTIRQY